MNRQHTPPGGTMVTPLESGSRAGGDSTRPVGVPDWTIGDRLRKARRAAGFEREDLADIIGCHPKTVGNYENDYTRAPKLVVREWALRTGVPYSWLVTGTPPDYIPPNTPATGGRPATLRMECPCCHMWAVLLTSDMQLVGVEGYAIKATAFEPIPSTEPGV